MKTEYIGRALIIASGLSPILLVLYGGYSYWGEFGRLSPGSGFMIAFTLPVYIVLFVAGLILYIKALKSRSATGRSRTRRIVEEVVTWLPLAPLGFLFITMVFMTVSVFFLNPPPSDEEMRAEADQYHDAHIPEIITQTQASIQGALEAYKDQYGRYPSYLVDVLTPPLFPYEKMSCPVNSPQEMRDRGYDDATILGYEFRCDTDFTRFSEEEDRLIMALRIFINESNTYTSDGIDYQLCYGSRTGKEPQCFSQ